MMGMAGMILPFPKKKEAVNLQIKRPPFVDRSVHCKFFVLLFVSQKAIPRSDRTIACQKMKILVVDRECAQNGAECVEKLFLVRLKS
jgi:hypothetical protein